MTVVTEILMFAYWAGFVGGILLALPLGFLAAIVVGLIQRRQRRMRAVSAKQFARELDEWVREIEEESAGKTQQALDNESQTANRL
jgi:hypothetical protein